MGTHRITIVAVGNHGCGRKAKDGSKVERCGNVVCVDCQAVAFVKQLQTHGDSIVSATLEHWPADQHNPTAGPVDDLVKGTRAGEFQEAQAQPPPGKT